jgi:hypothetical protein
MNGPMQKGFWTAKLKIERYGVLIPGERYNVVRRFTDYDGFAHEIGEGWTFLGSNYLPYDDGPSLFVSLNGKQEWHIRMQNRQEEQASIIAHLDQYITILPREIPEEKLIFKLAPWRRTAIALVFSGLGLIPLLSSFLEVGQWNLPSTTSCLIITGLFTIAFASARWGGTIVNFKSEELLIADARAMGHTASALSRLSVTQTQSLPYKGILGVEKTKSFWPGECLLLHLRTGEDVSFGQQLSQSDRALVLSQIEERIGAHNRS